jgi:hypothetical protein
MRACGRGGFGVCGRRQDRRRVVHGLLRPPAPAAGLCVRLRDALGGAPGVRGRDPRAGVSLSRLGGPGDPSRRGGGLDPGSGAARTGSARRTRLRRGSRLGALHRRLGVRRSHTARPVRGVDAGPAVGALLRGLGSRCGDGPVRRHGPPGSREEVRRAPAGRSPAAVPRGGFGLRRTWGGGGGQHRGTAQAVRGDLPVVGVAATVGSDAHEPGEVGAGWDAARGLLLEAGYSNVVVFRGREPHEVGL